MSHQTKVYGVIGNPVMHSLSPRIHNRGFVELDFDGVYVPFLVDDLEAFLDLARLLHVEGFSVTIPHKEAVLPFLATRDETVRNTGACNTVVRRTEGWCGVNTDVDGFLEPLRKRFDGSIPGGLPCTVVGAGGAARAVVYGLSRNRARVLVVNRSSQRARRLADEFGCRWAELDTAGMALMRQYSDLIVQTTSVGMEPDTSGDPIPDYVFSGTETVYDIVYKPRETCLLRRARAAGCTVLSGRQMFLSQAHAQFKLFAGTRYPAIGEETQDP